MNTSELILKLEQIIKKLRDPEDGCPWDLELTFESIIPNLLEESYETIETLRTKDFTAMPKELGDILMILMFISQMASEQNLFSFSNVMSEAINKLIRRHPHVFEENRKAKNADEALANWEAEKAKETANEKQKNISILEDIPRALPALMRAEKIQEKCAKVGFDWNNIQQVMNKIEEELQEVKTEINNNNTIALEEEIGDLLFSCVNLARHAKLNSEDVLSKANLKFTKRFQWIENTVKNSQKNLAEMNLTELEQLWQQSKLIKQ